MIDRYKFDPIKGIVRITDAEKLKEIEERENTPVDNTPTDEEIEESFEEVRSIRDNLLVDSDWTQLPDAPLNEAEKESWRIYRQDLRDITEDVDSDGLLDPIWPTDPTGYTYSDEDEDNFVDSDGSS